MRNLLSFVTLLIRVVGTLFIIQAAMFCLNEVYDSGFKMLVYGMALHYAIELPGLFTLIWYNLFGFPSFPPIPPEFLTPKKPDDENINPNT